MNNNRTTSRIDVIMIGPFFWSRKLQVRFGNKVISCDSLLLGNMKMKVE